MKSSKSKGGTTELPVSFADVQRAAETVKGAVINTDFDVSRTLGEMFGAEVWLKFENLQFTAAYKERGALNKLSSLTKKERSCGVIATNPTNESEAAGTGDAAWRSQGPHR